MSDFRINGITAKLEEWDEFKSCFELSQQGAAETESIIADNIIDPDEMFQIFDNNKDNKIDCWDFEKVNCTPLYYGCQKILGKYGFDIDKYSNKEFMLEAVKDNPALFEYASESLKKDKDVVFAAATRFTWAFQWADESLRADKGFVLELIEIEPDVLQYADKSLRTDKDILAAVAWRDIRIMSGDAPQWWEDLVSETGGNEDIFSIKALWAIFVEKHKDKLLQFFTEKKLKSIKKFKSKLANKYDIDFPLRFRSMDTILEVIGNRLKPYDPCDHRPVAVLIYAQEEWGPADKQSIGPWMGTTAPFEKYPLADRLRYLGYKVIYYEVRKQSDVTKYLKYSTDDGNHPADLIALAGHGQPDSLKLSSIVYWMFDSGQMDDGTPVLSDSSFIDTGDFDPDELHLANYIKPDGDLILYSCKNGAGGKDNPSNLANAAAKTLPEGVTVHSLQGEGNISDVYLTDDGEVGVKWGKSDGYKTNGTISK